MQDILAKYIQAVGTVLIGVALLTGIVLGRNILTNNTQVHTIVVTGKATSEFPPNQSIITGTWQTKGSTADAAGSALKDVSSKSIDALKQGGVLEKDIQTTESNVYPEYDYAYTYPNGQTPKILDYLASTVIQVTLTDPSKAEDTLGLMTKNGALSTSGPSLGLSSQAQDQLQKDLKVAAVTDAANQAKALAAQVGETLGSVVSITGGDLNNPGSPIPYAATSALSAGDSSSIAQGQEELSVTMTVTYNIR